MIRSLTLFPAVAWLLGNNLLLSSRQEVSAFVATPYYGSRTHHRSQPFLLHAVKTDEEILEIVREGIAEADATAAWNECVTLLQDSGVVVIATTQQETEMILATALEWRGWARVSSAMARKFMKPKQPDPVKLQAALQWLKDGPLALSGDALGEAIQQSPAAYLIDPEAAYQEALQTAPAKYKDPDYFKAVLLQDPSVLECSYNCVDEGCGSECGNCWVSYEIKRGSSVPDPF
ncbi:expressed unknown protein [Seminavis robusta]|uniref:Uncharacterized protein n=1 Tax=Seminavis robusta TaxID=568900 RepID=A0A9N8EY44_9STRA|nr:expressed unknown protein [Seminavis robusta]|eukprot:Sro1950_g307350.1 n/a (233) ;mRNA; f:1985-2683